MLVTNTLKNMEKLERKNLCDYHVLYVQSDTLLLASVFESLATSVLKYMSYIQFNFFNTGISMASMLKKDRSRIRITN